MAYTGRVLCHLAYQGGYAGSNITVRRVVAARAGLVDLPLDYGRAGVEDCSDEVAAGHSLDEREVNPSFAETGV